MDKIPVGYKAICEQLKLSTLPHYRESYIAKHGRGKTIIDNHHEIHIYPKTYILKNEHDLLANLEFALKYDGMNLEIIKLLFENIDKKIVVAHIKQQLTGTYSRKIWFLYELLMGDKLNLQDCKRIKYVDLLDTKMYFTCQGTKSTRHGINNNLLGNNQFCPFVRHTEILDKYISLQLDSAAKGILEKYDITLITRACNYLYTKETISSFEIEKERPDKSRVARFINMLQQASKIDFLSKDQLIELQNSIVDPRYKDFDYRHRQNYVGENIRFEFSRIHYISPKPNDVPELMQGILDALNRMITARIHPVIIAAAISFGFVFIHPFEDGNGRIHRFLIHYILAKANFVPKDMIFPVSAIMLKNLHAYDVALESFSKPLLKILTDYDLSEDGTMTVKQDSKLCYQYIDFTLITEYLFKCIQEAIHEYMEKEILFILNYDKTKKTIQKIVDLPDRNIDLIIKFVTQNNGELSKNKRKDYFALLTDQELKKIIACIRENMMRNI